MKSTKRATTTTTTTSSTATLHYGYNAMRAYSGIDCSCRRNSSSCALTTDGVRRSDGAGANDHNGPMMSSSISHRRALPVFTERIDRRDTLKGLQIPVSTGASVGAVLAVRWSIERALLHSVMTLTLTRHCIRRTLMPLTLAHWHIECLGVYV